MAITELQSDFYKNTGHRLSSSSLLRLFNLLRDHDETKFMNIFRSYSLNDDVVEDTVYYNSYEVENDDWWDNISFKYYGTPNLWWVICMMNNITNPFEEINPGDNIKILKSEFLYQFLQDVEGMSSL
jgi:nucleoid-associated protein YgaU